MTTTTRTRVAGRPDDEVTMDELWEIIADIESLLADRRALIDRASVALGRDPSAPPGRSRRHLSVVTERS